MSQSDLLEQLPSFQLKGGMLPLTTIELINPQISLFASQLADKLAQAPEFFQDAPIILGLDKLPGRLSEKDLEQVLLSMQQQGLHLVGIRADHQQDIAAAKARQLPILPPINQRGSHEHSGTDNSSTNNGTGLQPAKIVQQPVRGGQQIYAKNSDLIILGPVNNGAEVLADGNIHIYGALRGKAAAGLSGNPDARIFCQHLEAEILSIAGNYKLSEDMRGSPLWQQPAQISLQGEQLVLQSM